MAKSVFVIEDDISIRESLSDLLEMTGYSVLQCANGKEGLEALEKARQKPCLILLDLMMPVMNGWEFLDELDKQWSEYASIPLVVLSAAAEDSLEGHRDKILKFIKKPVSMKDLMGIVKGNCG